MIEPTKGSLNFEAIIIWKKGCFKMHLFSFVSSNIKIDICAITLDLKYRAETRFGQLNAIKARECLMAPMSQ